MQGCHTVPSCMFSVQYLAKLTSRNLIFSRVSFCGGNCKKSQTHGFKGAQKKKDFALFSEIKSGRVGFRVEFKGDQRGVFQQCRV